MSVKDDLALCKKYIALLQSADSRGIEFKLSLTALKNLKRSKRCYYTGDLFTDKNRMSIDRVDNSKGYEDGNVVACGESLNHRKTNLSVEEILALAKGIQRRAKK